MYRSTYLMIQYFARKSSSTPLPEVLVHTWWYSILPGSPVPPPSPKYWYGLDDTVFCQEVQSHPPPRGTGTYLMIQYFARKSSGSEASCNSSVVTGASATLPLRRCKNGFLKKYYKSLIHCKSLEPRHEKTCLWDLRPGKTQTSLLSWCG